MMKAVIIVMMVFKLPCLSIMMRFMETLTRQQQGARSRSESLFVITNWSPVFFAIMTSASKNI